ncbi:MAG: hypothetical protein OXJ62_10845 [Spirochaetaceae bacterium]|nr:hypothetical protein [Spirochaetaceae bacterium]
MHALTRLPGYRDAGHLRADYEEIEDCGALHVTFADGTVADVFASEIVLGGVYNWLEVFANNHRTRCNLNPIDALHTYNPVEEQLDDVYVVEKIGTKQGWSQPAPDEDWMHGYQQELAHFYECFRRRHRPAMRRRAGIRDQRRAVRRLPLRRTGRRRGAGGRTPGRAVSSDRPASRAAWAP